MERVFKEHLTMVTSLAASPDGKTIATGDSTGASQLWDLGGKSPRSTLRDPAGKETIVLPP